MTSCCDNLFSLQTDFFSSHFSFIIITDWCWNARRPMAPIAVLTRKNPCIPKKGKKKRRNHGESINYRWADWKSASRLSVIHTQMVVSSWPPKLVVPGCVYYAINVSEEEFTPKKRPVPRHVWSEDGNVILSESEINCRPNPINNLQAETLSLLLIVKSDCHFLISLFELVVWSREPESASLFICYPDW